jgi:hypothetical protein
MESTKKLNFECGPKWPPSSFDFHRALLDWSRNALGWIRPQFARFASPEFSKQVNAHGAVSGCSAVTVVSAANLVKGIIAEFGDEPNFGMRPICAPALNIADTFR